MNTGLYVDHDYQGHLWCGIAALSAAIEIKTSQAKKIIRSVSLRRYVKAVTYTEMAHALVASGYGIKRHHMPYKGANCPTMSDWVEQHRPWDRIYVICITGHWVVVQGDHWVCGMNHVARLNDDSPYKQARVRHVVEIISQTTSGS
jgi:hypothetical protein